VDRGIAGADHFSRKTFEEEWKTGEKRTGGMEEGRKGGRGVGSPPPFACVTLEPS